MVSFIMEEIKMEKCNHVIGLVEGYEGGLLVLESEKWLRNQKKELDEKFNFCPVCGERLECSESP